MESLENNKDEIAYSFAQLIDKIRKDYFDSNDIDFKENIVSNFIIDNQISEDFLKSFISRYSNEICTDEVYINIINTYLENLVYSLNSENIKNINNLIGKLNSQLNSQKLMEKKLNFFAYHDPINNFVEFLQVYKKIDDLNPNSKSEKEKEYCINEIDKYLEKMSKEIYDIDLDNYNFPPSSKYPTYSYNYYSFKIFQILNKFKKKRNRNNPFSKGKQKNEKYKNYRDLNEKWKIYNQIYFFFKDFNILFEKLNYNNIERDIRILKIVTCYLVLFEHSRDYINDKINFEKIIKCLDSNPISEKILDKYELYRKDNNNKISKNDWNKIGVNEEVIIKEPINIVTKIKHFNENILELDSASFYSALKKRTMENLSIDGFINYSIIKYNTEVEEYSKNLLKKILFSNKYINIFKKNDNRFDLIKEENDINNQIKDEKINKKIKNTKIFKSMFNGPNKDEIFEELWDNVFFIPLFDKISGFNNRTQYSIFINSSNNFSIIDSLSSKIIARMHNEINTLVHEFSHNLALLIAANIGENNFETQIIITDDNLLKIQVEYKKIYNQKGNIYDEFSDFGDLIEVELYGIKPGIFKTFSALFCLNKNSYNLEEFNNEIFRKICANLYNYNGVLNDPIIIALIIESENDEDVQQQLLMNKIEQLSELEKNLVRLLRSDFMKLVLKSFNIKSSDLINDSFEEDGNARCRVCDLFYNEEYHINTNYCDKLDDL